MRGTILVLSFAATCFGAQASSIVSLGGVPTATPSIIALGEPAPAVSDDKVAAIPKATPSLSPMVIRGGVSAGAASRLAAAKTESSLSAGSAPSTAAAQPVSSPASSRQPL